MVTIVRNPEEIAQMVESAYSHSMANLESTRARILRLIKETEDLTDMPTDLWEWDKISISQATEDACWKNAIQIFVKSIISTQYNSDLLVTQDMDQVDIIGLENELKRLSQIDLNEMLQQIISGEKMSAMESSIADFNAQNSQYKLSDISKETIEKFFTSFLKKHQEPLHRYIREKLNTVLANYIVFIKAKLYEKLQEELENKKQYLRQEQDSSDVVIQELSTKIKDLGTAISWQWLLIQDDTTTEFVILVIRELQDLIEQKRKWEDFSRQIQSDFQSKIASIQDNIQDIENYIERLREELWSSDNSFLKTTKIPFPMPAKEEVELSESWIDASPKLSEWEFDRSFREYNSQHLNFSWQNQSKNLSVSLLDWKDIITVNNSEVPVQWDKYFTVPGVNGKTRYLVLWKKSTHETQFSKTYNSFEWNIDEKKWEDSNSMDMIGDKLIFIDDQDNYIIRWKNVRRFLPAIPFEKVTITQDAAKSNTVVDRILFLTQSAFIDRFIKNASNPQ